MGHTLELALRRDPVRSDVPIELIRRQQSAAAAFCLACQAAGLEDKEIYLPMGIDAGTFSRIKKGEANLPADKEAEFCMLVGNTIYPEWRAYQIGCTLTMLKSEAERRAEELERLLIDAQNRERLLKEILAGKA